MGALAYVPETGTGADLTAYGYAPSLAFIRAYNAQRGVVLPVDDDKLIPLATVAMDLIETFEPAYKGDRTQPLLQPVSWPRVNAYIQVPKWRGGTPFASDAIPIQLQTAHAYLTGVALTVDLFPIIEGRAVTKEVIGPIETDYSVTAGSPTRPLITQLTSILAPLCNFQATLKSVRV